MWLAQLAKSAATHMLSTDCASKPKSKGHRAKGKGQRQRAKGGGVRAKEPCTPSPVPCPLCPFPFPPGPLAFAAFAAFAARRCATEPLCYKLISSVLPVRRLASNRQVLVRENALFLRAPVIPGENHQ